MSEAGAHFATITVQALASGGDGVAYVEGRPVFVEQGLPGEVWKVQLGRDRKGNAAIKPIACIANARSVSPICRHFTQCGGCTLQHLPESDYRSFKFERVRRALRQHRLPIPEATALEIAPPHSRRRIRLAYHFSGSRLHLGYREHGSKRVVSVAECPIAVKEIEILLAPLVAHLRRLSNVGQSGEIVLTMTDSGIDLVLKAIEYPGADDLEAWREFAVDQDLARVTWSPSDDAGASVVERREVVLLIEGVRVPLPPTAFVQATEWGEQRLRQLIDAHLGDARLVLDLFAGFGALSMTSIRRGRRVVAFEQNKLAVQALQKVALTIDRGTVQAEVRDLDRHPVGAEYLARCDAVIMDPPRSGALRQSEQLAVHGPRQMVYASCNPGSFARDARVLLDHGYKILELAVVDQFLFSPETELVAVLERS